MMIKNWCSLHSTIFLFLFLLLLFPAVDFVKSNIDDIFYTLAILGMIGGIFIREHKEDSLFWGMSKGLAVGFLSFWALCFMLWLSEVIVISLIFIVGFFGLFF